MFVLLPGRSRAEAFRIGEEIAREVTAANPPPVVLKMEKVCGGGWGQEGVVFSSAQCAPCHGASGQHFAQAKHLNAPNSPLSSACLVFTPPLLHLQVYDPCVLLSKKRYVGFAYETPSQVGGWG